MTLTFHRCQVMPAKKNNLWNSHYHSGKWSWSYIDNVLKMKAQFSAALKGANSILWSMREKITSEPEAVLILLYIYKRCVHLKYLHGDLDPQIKNANMEIEKIQRRAIGKLKLWNGFLLMSEQQDSTACRTIDRRTISHSSIAYSIPDCYGEGKF